MELMVDVLGMFCYLFYVEKWAMGVKGSGQSSGNSLTSNASFALLTR